MLEKNQIYHGDCLEVMQNILDKSIDAIICDLPYGITACKWDIVIPFDKMWLRLNKLIKPNRAIVLFGNEPFSSVLRMSNIKNFRYDWVWNRKRVSGFLNSKKRPLVQHELIHLFYKQQCLYNPQFHKKKLNRDFNGKIQKEDKTKVYGKQKEYISNVIADKSFPRSIIEITAVIGNSKEKIKHPTQKPIALMEYLIKTYTNENDLVLDFCIGSGTTAIACLNTNRNFIGIEKEKKYFNIAIERIKNYKKIMKKKLI